jgi:hypothetical protein
MPRRARHYVVRPPCHLVQPRINRNNIDTELVGWVAMPNISVLALPKNKLFQTRYSRWFCWALQPNLRIQLGQFYPVLTESIERKWV